MAQPGHYLPRHLDKALAQAILSSPIVVLDGARGTGKTTTARRMCASSIMLPRELPALKGDPEAYLRSLPTPVLLDEWQLAGPDLLWILKGIVDDDPAPGRFVLTGSVEPAAYGPTYPLTGRAVRLVLRPMTRSELEGNGDATTFMGRLLIGVTPTVSAGRSPRFDPSWLRQSGFPAARDLPDPALFLESYAVHVAQRAGDEGRDASRLMRTMRALATLTAQAVPDQRLWESADINKATWKIYDDLLTRVHLSTPTPAFESNRLKRLTAYPKRFLADTALALTLAGVQTDELHAHTPGFGPYLESFVMQQLRPHVDQVRGALLHLRTGAGEREVDAVIEIGNSAVLGIEVKAGVRPTGRDARQLAWLRDQLGERFTHGFVVHTGGDTYPLGDQLWAIPVETLC